MYIDEQVSHESRAILPHYRTEHDVQLLYDQEEIICADCDGFTIPKFTNVADQDGSETNIAERLPKPRTREDPRGEVEDKSITAIHRQDGPRSNPRTNCGPNTKESHEQFSTFPDSTVEQVRNLKKDNNECAFGQFMHRDKNDLLSDTKDVLPPERMDHDTKNIEKKVHHMQTSAEFTKESDSSTDSKTNGMSKSECGETMFYSVLLGHKRKFLNL